MLSQTRDTAWDTAFRAAPAGKHFVRPIGKALGIWIVLFVAIMMFGVAIEPHTPQPIMNVVGVILWGVPTLVAFLSWFRGRHGSVANAVASSAVAAKSFRESVATKVRAADAAYFALAEKEVDEGHTDRGLWSVALVNVDGDEARRKVEYMRLRVAQMKKSAPRD